MKAGSKSGRARARIKAHRDWLLVENQRLELRVQSYRAEALLRELLERLATRARPTLGQFFGGPYA